MDAKTDKQFRRAITAEPNNESLRLVYADWLEEQGDSDRAEFIRIQIASKAEEKAGFGFNTTRQRELRGRMIELLRTHEDEWKSELPMWVTSANFHRGFLEEFRIVNERPVVSITLADLEQLVSQFPVTSLTTIRVQQQLVRELVRSHMVRNLHTLNLSDNGLTTVDARFLASSDSLASLRRLILSDNCIGPQGARAILLSPQLQNLSQIDLDGNWFSVSPGLLAQIQDRFTCRGRVFHSLPNRDVSKSCEPFPRHF